MDVAKLTSVDLFAGAGGLTLGLSNAGFESVFVNDSWKPAIETLALNFPNTHISSKDIRDVSVEDVRTAPGSSGDLTLVAGGPPCQGFTSAGARRSDDQRNTLVGEFARLAIELQPEWILFENVEGFLTMNKGEFVVDLLDPIIAAGYQVRLRKVNVANYGVPQLRKRVIALARRGGDPGFPGATHHAFGAPGVSIPSTRHLPRTATVKGAISGLEQTNDSVESVPTHHVARVPSGDELARITALAEGQTMRDLPTELQHESFKRRANRRVADGMPTEKRGGAPAGMRRLIADQPSKAITSAASREFVHPSLDRGLTLRECARLQGFPDSFRFEGNRSEVATLIGNAIPPDFGYVFGQWVSALDLRDSEAVGGQLLEFKVTNGAGMSPALEAVVRRIEERYEIGALTLWR